MAHLGVLENELELVRNMLLPTATFIRQGAVAHNGLSQRLPPRGRTDCLAGVQLPQVHMPDRRRDDRGDGGRAVVLPRRVGGIISCYF
ncbi:hypothetical protein PVAP13_2NG279600 [Panicum virgatum]|uniref:Uncharacterized protein n=1 Tax=Panicum virgatum TaxID=38727 RepID=A0A8T0VFW8_PANVG|nr:hypothetical protein PVAP13_2NG279600 [Panicum virgatum]KAG2633307.1 hypothetical protein PVAP13_2NG279600 [Panicum virgatum]